MSAWQILGLIAICAIPSLAVWSVYAAACPLNPPDDEEEEPMTIIIEKPEQPTELQKFFMSKTPITDNKLLCNLDGTPTMTVWGCHVVSAPDPAVAPVATCSALGLYRPDGSLCRVSLSTQRTQELEDNILSNAWREIQPEDDNRAGIPRPDAEIAAKAAGWRVLPISILPNTEVTCSSPESEAATEEKA